MQREKKTLLSFLLAAAVMAAVIGLAVRKQAVSRIPESNLPLAEETEETMEENVTKEQSSANASTAVRTPMTAELLDAYMEEQYGHPTKDYLQISTDDYAWSDGYYFVDNPEREQYLGIVASKTADFDGDGETEAFALCLQEQTGYEDTKILTTQLMGFNGNGSGKPMVNFTGLYATIDGTWNVAPLWDKVEADYVELSSFLVQMYYLNLDGNSYIVVFTTREKNYFNEEYVAIYHYEQPDKDITRLASACISKSKTTENMDILFYDREESSVSLVEGSDLSQTCLQLQQLLAQYQIGVDMSEEIPRFYFKNEEGILLGSVRVRYDNLDTPSGYEMYVTGNKVEADEMEDAGEKITVDASAGAVTLSGTLKFCSVESSSGNGMMKELYVLKLDPQIREMTMEDGTLISQIEEIDVGQLEESVQGEYSGRPVQITGRVSENFAGGYWLNSLSIHPDEITYLDE